MLAGIPRELINNTLSETHTERRLIMYEPSLTMCIDEPRCLNTNLSGTNFRGDSIS